MKQNSTRPCRTGATIASVLLGLSLLAFNADAAPKTSALNVVPTITSIDLVDGQLVASGTANAVIKGREYTAPFSNVPVNISLADDQTGAVAAGCPILDLELGPITLDLLGLVVETSPICLQITAYQGGGLLGDLLCGIANLLSGDGIIPGLPLDDILGALDQEQLTGLLTEITDLLNAALANLNQAQLVGIGQGGTPPGQGGTPPGQGGTPPGQGGTPPGQGGARTCAILNLELGPLNLNLLGLEVILDNCEGEAITVDITARRGALLGNLLCGLLGQLTLGDLLEDILGRLLNLGPL
jgi:hypothetical protein